MKKKALLLATALSALVHQGNFASTKNQIVDHTKHQIAVSFGGQESKQDAKTVYVSWIQEKISDKNPDSMNHQTIITMHMDDILVKYGKEKWLDIIRQHMLIEINLLREQKWLSKLMFNTILNNSTQKHAEFLSKNAHLYDFTWINKTQSPHIEYSHNGDMMNTPWTRASSLWYHFSLIKENISTIWFLRWKEKWSITEILQERLWEKGHAENIFSPTKDIWIAYEQWIVVINFANSQ